MLFLSVIGAFAEKRRCKVTEFIAKGFFSMFHVFSNRLQNKWKWAFRSTKAEI